jgi:ketosteroid isomerase-like protein
MSKRAKGSCFFVLAAMISASSIPGFLIGQPADSGIQDMIDAWVAMWNSYDLTMVDTLFLQDSRVSYFSSERQGLIQGIEAVRDHHAGFGFVEGGKIQANKLWVEDVHIRNFGSMAVIAGIWYFGRKTGEEDSIQKGPFTFVCVQVRQGWRLVHLNFSEYK